MDLHGQRVVILDIAALDLDRAREFFALRYFGAGGRARRRAAPAARRLDHLDHRHRRPPARTRLGGRREIGILTPGQQADMAVIDVRSPHLDGFGDPVAVMVLGAGPADVETVIVGGDVVPRLPA